MAGMSDLDFIRPMMGIITSIHMRLDLEQIRLALLNNSSYLYTKKVISSI